MLAHHHVVGMGYLGIAAPQLDLTALDVRVQRRFADNIRLAIKALGVLQFRQRPVAGMLVEPPAGISGTRCRERPRDRKSTRLNSSHTVISYAVFCLKKKKQ